MLTYLKVQPSYLGLKQDRFNLLLPNGTLDYKIKDGRTEYNTNRPKALCFDYSMLRHAYNLNLETSAVSEYELNAGDDSEDNNVASASTSPAAPPSLPTLFQREDDEPLPF